MDAAIGLVLIIVLAIVVMPIIALVRAAGAERVANELRGRVAALEGELERMRRAGASAGESAVPVVGAASAPAADAFKRAAPSQLAAGVTVVQGTAPIQAAANPAEVLVKPSPAFLREDLHDKLSGPTSTPPETEKPAVTKPAPAAEINWEQFMGAKLFAWIGGVALFFGIALFVKYSFDHNLVPPEVRVAIGFVAGLGLLAGGNLMKRKENAVTAQTLCATGILVLYAVTFACRTYYHFAFFGLIPTFVLMASITAAAFVVSVRMDALAVAVLGIAGGFLTPVILSSGQDNPVGLFSYIAFLDIGLLAVARRQKWQVLPILGAIGTILMEGSWIQAFFVSGGYFLGSKILVTMTVLAGFQALFLAATWWSGRDGQDDDSFAEAALATGLAALLGVFYFATFVGLRERPILLFGYLFLVDAGLVGCTLITRRFDFIRTMVGIAAFVFIGMWIEDISRSGFLFETLGAILVFALFHSALPIVLARWRKTVAPAWAQMFPIFSLVLMFVPILQFHQNSILIWSFLLLINAMALGVAVLTSFLMPVIAILLLSMVAIGGMMFQTVSDVNALPADLITLGVCAVFFMGAGAWSARKLTPENAGPPELLGSFHDPANLQAQLPVLSAILPFGLLLMVINQLPLANPNGVFGLALLLVVLLLGLTRMMSLDALAVVALVCVLPLEYAWQVWHSAASQPVLSLTWYLVFYGVFTLFPFLFSKHFSGKKLPWAASALAGPAHFYLTYHAGLSAYPRVPHALFAGLFAIPAIAGLLIRKRAALNTLNPARLSQLALYGGAALFFITLIFPLQFHRQWITISWALEGAALCWYFRRVPHPGLRLVGVGLLLVAFCRLSLNPIILSYHARTGVPILNWYLYAFAVVSAALYAAAWLLEKPRNMIGQVNVPPVFYCLGTVLIFLLVNIEIADYFSPPGARVLTFDFLGNFARDMSYSIAWGLFALALLILGMLIRNKTVRRAGIGLLSVTLLKLFLHDLSELDQLYRIGAFIVVAVIAIFASFLYQRFMALPEHTTEPPAP